MRLGLFGGTFDPPHIGHLIVAQDALAALRLDRIIFIPAGVPPHKQKQHVTPAEVRLDMLKAAIGTDDRFEIETLELDRAGPSYSVDTVAALRLKYPGAELFFLIGADQFQELDTWREPERLGSLATIVVMNRYGAHDDMGSEPAAGAPAGRPPDTEIVGVQYVNVTRVDISSTSIRGLCRAGAPIRYLVSPGVEAYLRMNTVYDR